MATKTS